MHKPTLTNFLPRNLPEGIPELLALLGFIAAWKPSDREWIIIEEGRNSRMTWSAKLFTGGTTEQWQQFLSAITAVEYVRG